MCGIAGIYGELADKQIVLKMLESIVHRGRDDQGVFVDSSIGLGCNRLSIIDVAGGHQPISNEEGDIWVVLNGEIYNHDNLRKHLRELGRSFRTRSDTEVVAQSFREWGTECFQHLNGMYAVAVWDSNTSTLHLARDRVGIKPLYFASFADGLLFGSEVKAILQSGLVVNVTVNSRMVEQLVEVGYPLEPETLLNEVHQVPPGTRLQIDKDGHELARFWEIPKEVDVAPSPQTVRKALRDSVLRQTITSDVPVGAFLSGGLDTSTIVAFASKARSDGLKTFCMGFKEITDEFADARVVAEAFGTDHHEILVDASDMMSIFPEMIWHSELPKVNLYSWFVDEAASKYVKVCLSGLGGDELFAGYTGTRRFSYARKMAVMRKFRPLFDIIGKLGLVPNQYAGLIRSLETESSTYATYLTGFPSENVSAQVKEPVDRYFDGRISGFESEIAFAEFNTKLPYDYLLAEDAMSMAHTLEVRVPLLDDILLQLMLPVPYHYNVTGDIGRIGKRLMREAVKDLLPPLCLRKPKWGFSVDVFSWWKRAVRECAAKRVPQSEFLRAVIPKWHEKVCSKIMQQPDIKNNRWYSMAWMMLGLDIWADLFLKGEVPQKVSL